MRDPRTSKQDRDSERGRVTQRAREKQARDREPGSERDRVPGRERGRDKAGGGAGKPSLTRLFY